MDRKMEGVPAIDNPFTTESWTLYQTRRAPFLVEYQEYRNSTAVQKQATDTAMASLANLYKYESHYFRVLNMAIERGVFPASVRGYYGLENDVNPSLKSDAELTAWGAQIANGEAARVAAGGAPMAMPSAAEVAAALAQYNTDQDTQANAKLANNAEEVDVALVFPGMVEAIMDLYDQLAFIHRKQSVGFIHNVQVEYGMQLGNQAGETTTLTITVAAGSNYTVNEFTPNLTTTVDFTLETNPGPGGVWVCRNVLSGCAGTGKELVFDTVVSAIFGEMPGDDPQVVISNSTATDVVVKIKFVG